MSEHVMEKRTNNQIAWHAAQDIADGAYVNLGIGFPEKMARFQPPGREAIFHTENGSLNFGDSSHREPRIGMSSMRARRW